MKKLNELLTDLEPSLRSMNSIAGNPKDLYEPIRYILDLGGKRIRPAMVLAAYRMYNSTYNKAVMELAESVEMFHNFTLLHDDIMDKADLRRGRSTVHKKWDEPTAILSGDLLLILVYQKLSKLNDQRVLDLFSSMAIELCEGQMNDMLFEQRDTVTNDEYLEMIRQKTAVLLGFSLQAGALLAGASEQEASELYDLGIEIGLAFQLMDDYLDSFGNNAKVGKRIGGDILERKKTFLWNELWIRSTTEQRNEIMNSYSEGEEETISKIKSLMEQTGAKEATLKLAQQYSQRSSALLDTMQVKGDKQYLQEIVALLSERES